MGFQPILQTTWEKFFDEAKELHDYYPEYEDIPDMDEVAKLVPTRATVKSAGYDFRIPFDMHLEAGKEYVIPTGFKWDPYDSEIVFRERQEVFDIDRYKLSMAKVKETGDCSVLQLYPRSSLAFKYGFKLLNTVGIIDADYCNNPDNEGHILVGLTVSKDLDLHAGDKLCQGVIQLYSVCHSEIQPDSERMGGVGSTGA